MPQVKLVICETGKGKVKLKGEVAKTLQPQDSSQMFLLPYD